MSKIGTPEHDAWLEREHNRFIDSFSDLPPEDEDIIDPYDGEDDDDSIGPEPDDEELRLMV